MKKLRGLRPQNGLNPINVLLISKIIKNLAINRLITQLQLLKLVENIEID